MSMIYKVQSTIILNNKDTSNYVSFVDIKDNGFVIHKLGFDVNQITVYKKMLDKKIRDFKMRTESNQSPAKPSE